MAPGQHGDWAVADRQYWNLFEEAWDILRQNDDLACMELVPQLPPEQRDFHNAEIALRMQERNNAWERHLELLQPFQNGNWQL